MPLSRLFLFGNVRVALADRQISFPSGPVASLLGYLGLQASGGRAISRSRLAGTLWPDQPEARARRNLADTLYRLRRLLGDDANSRWLKADDETVGLQDVWVDVDSFRTLSALTQIDDWRSAVELYRGDLLEELDADWALGSRAELRELNLLLLQRLCESLNETGDLPDALTYAHRWALADPLSDEACRAAMQFYARLGRHAAALQQYDRFSRQLNDELGIEPLPETRKLAEMIRAEARQVERPGAEAPALHRSFVGRRRERALLLKLAETALAGRGALALVEGEPGVGKTRLLEELAEGSAWRGLTVVWGRARALAGLMPYAPLDEALQAAVAGPRAEQVRQRISPRTAELLGSLIPRWAVSRTSPVEVEPMDLPAAIAEAFNALAEVAPHVFIFDDVQWVEPTFWDAMQKLAPQLSGQRLLVVLCYRSEDARTDETAWSALRDLDRDLAPLKLVLSGLAAAECAELAHGMGYSLGNDAAFALYQRTGGNPFYITEVVAQVEAESASLQGLIHRRFAALTPQSQTALQAAAVMGREFTHGAWQSIVGAGLPGEIPLLLSARFVEESETGYRFQHDVTREYVYQAIGPDSLRELHRRSGEALLRERADPAVLAWHFEQAEQWPEAVRYHREAGECAVKAYAYTAALEHCERALTLLSALADRDIEYMAVCRCKLRALNNLRYGAEWAAAMEALEKAALSNGDQPALLEALQSRISLLGHHFDWEGMQTAAEQAITLAHELGDLAGEAYTLFIVGVELANRWARPIEALPYLKRAAELAEAAGNSQYRLEVLLELAQAQRLAGQCLSVRLVVQQILAQTEERPDLLTQREAALDILGYVEVDLAHWQTAHALLSAAIGLSESLNNTEALFAAVYARAYVEAFTGRISEARRTLEMFQARPAYLRIATKSHMPVRVQTLLAEIFLQTAQLLEAEQVLVGLQTWMNEVTSGRVLQEALTALGRLRLAQGRPAEASQVLERAVRVWKMSSSTVDVRPLLYFALAACQTGNIETARHSLVQAEQAVRASDVLRYNVLLYYVRFEISGHVEDLQAARDEIQRQADSFTDLQWRADFLNQVSLHRQIESRWQALQSAGSSVVTVRLARADAPLGKPLTDADRIDVRWTVDAGPADSNVLHHGGKVALRRRRLTRLIAEARAQGAAPTDADLAQALGVDVRTIGRDMAAIRAQGEAAPTRKRRT